MYMKHVWAHVASVCLNSTLVPTQPPTTSFNSSKSQSCWQVNSWYSTSVKSWPLLYSKANPPPKDTCRQYWACCSHWLTEQCTFKVCITRSLQKKTQQRGPPNHSKSLEANRIKHIQCSYGCVNLPQSSRGKFESPKRSYSSQCQRVGCCGSHWPGWRPRTR